MRTTGRALAVATTVAALVCVLTACTERAPSGRAPAEHACEPPPTPAIDGHPEIDAVEADGYDRAPGALASRVSLGTLARHARSGPSRADAEQFGLLFAQAVLDSREQVDAQRLVDGFVADELPRTACQSVLSRLPYMHELGWGLYVDPAETAWVRSRAVGGSSSPDRVEVELVLTVGLENDPGLFDVEPEPIVVRARVDVVRQDDTWLVAGWSSPNSAAVEPGERPAEEYYGVGWRSWRPGVLAAG